MKNATPSIDPQELSPKDLKIRWAPMSPKTVQRTIARLGLQAYRVIGVWPRFRLADVVAAEARAKEAVNARIVGDRVLTIKQARTLAGGKKRRK